MEEAAALDIARHRDFNITLAAITCCGVRALRSSPTEHEAPTNDLEYKRLMTPLIGRCMRLLIGWWTYEVCWPWRVRQLRFSMEGEVEDIGTVLGHFNKSQGLVRRRAVPRQEEESAFELFTLLEGDQCGQTVQSWDITTGHVSVAAVGGSFNPARLLAVEGRLTLEQSNEDGCNPYGDIRLDGAIVLAKRGGCWFHTKSLMAQAAGAAAVIVLNAQHHMVDLMEGVDELVSPGIPTVLVEDDAGQALLELIGTHVELKKTSFEGDVELGRPLSTTVTFRCSSVWQNRHQICMQGDEVAVKLPPKNKSDIGSRWPRSSVQVLRATVDEIFHETGTILVTWLPSDQLEEDVDLTTLPDTVPLSTAYHEGVPCDSRGGARIEEVAEVQACSTEFIVHVPELCAHPRLVPPRPRDTQVINCIAEEGVREALLSRRQRVLEELGDLSVEDLRLLHSRFDWNADGMASFQEILHSSHEIRVFSLEAQEITFMNGVDANEDGILSFAEHIEGESKHVEYLDEAKKQRFYMLSADFFEAVDLNRDGRLDAHESKAYHYPFIINEVLRRKTAMTMMIKDVDDNNELTEEEFGPMTEDEGRTYLSKPFDLLDKDGSGTLSAEELQVWQAGNLYVEHFIIGTLFSIADDNKDEMLTVDELVENHQEIVYSPILDDLKDWCRTIKLYM